MNEQHKATPEQWEVVELCQEKGKIPWLTATCLLELRARVEALEAASRRDGAPVYGAYNEAGELQGVVPASAFPSPASSLVERNPECVANWPDCYEGGYNPHCCRFPKSCSCEVRHEVPESATPTVKDSPPAPAGSPLDQVAVFGAYNATNDREAFVPLPEDERLCISTTAPAGSLVERVGSTALIEVAAWLQIESEGDYSSGLYWAQRLRQEADR
jgi:hypothetical protein